MTPDDILSLRDVAEKATPGPWEIRGEASYDVWAPATANICGANIIMHDGGQTADSMYANRDYIATFDPPTVLALLDRLAALEEVAGAAVEAEDQLRMYGSGVPLITARHTLRAALDRLQSSGAGGSLPSAVLADPAPDDVKEEE